MYILFSNKLRPGPVGVLIRWLLFPLGVLFCFKDSDRVFLKVFFLSLTLNILTPLSFSFLRFLSFFFLNFFLFLILIQGCFSTVVKGGTQGELAPGPPKTLFYVRNFKM